jgi:hypothetical protein
LESQGIEIGKTRHVDPSADFLPLTAIVMGGDNLKFDSKPLQFFAKAENEHPRGISGESWEGGCEDQNSQRFPAGKVI